MGVLISKLYRTNTVHPIETQNIILPEPPHTSHIEDHTVYPSYYSNLCATHHEYLSASRSWRLITDNKVVPDLHTDAVVFFYKTFYEKLFLIFPEIKTYFKNDIHIQGRMLIRMVSYLLDSFYNHDVFKTVHDLALQHNKYNIKAFHYFIFGDILFYSLQETLGKILFDNFCYHGWCKLYSAMLRVILPIVHKVEDNHLIGMILYHNAVDHISQTAIHPLGPGNEDGLPPESPGPSEESPPRFYKRRPSISLPDIAICTSG